MQWIVAADADLGPALPTRDVVADAISERCGNSFKKQIMIAPPRELTTKCASRLPKYRISAARFSASAVSEYAVSGSSDWP